MATVDLTSARLRELLSYDPETGVFRNRFWRGGKMKAGSIAGNPSTDGHLKMSVDRRLYLAHRLAWFYMHEAWPTHQIDHINGDPADNRLCNLRDVCQAVNNQNQRKPQRANKTGFLGVRLRKGRFHAKLSVGGGKTKHIGCFTTAEEASAAYLEAKRRLHEGCTI